MRFQRVLGSPVTVAALVVAAGVVADFAHALNGWLDALHEWEAFERESRENLASPFLVTVVDDTADWIDGVVFAAACAFPLWLRFAAVRAPVWWVVGGALVVAHFAVVLVDQDADATDEFIVVSRLGVAWSALGVVAALLAAAILVRERPGRATWAGVRAAVRAGSGRTALLLALTLAALVFLDRVGGWREGLGRLDRGELLGGVPDVGGVVDVLAVVALAAFGAWGAPRWWWVLSLAAGCGLLVVDVVPWGDHPAAMTRVGSAASILAFAACAAAIVLLARGRAPVGPVVLRLLMLLVAGAAVISVVELVDVYRDVLAEDVPGDGFTPTGAYVTTVELEGPVLVAVALALAPFVPVAVWLRRRGRATAMAAMWWVVTGAFAVATPVTCLAAAGESGGSDAVWAIRGLLVTGALALSSAVLGVGVLRRVPGEAPA